MKKILEVQEFDKIICKESFADGKKYKYLPKKEFADLKEFIYSYASYNPEDPDITRFMKIDFKSNLGEVITFQNYVGVIKLPGGCTIQILPKISLNGASEFHLRETKKILLKMLKSMKDVPSETFQFAGLDTARMDIYEIFIHMYLQEVIKLLKSGLRSGYIERQDNLNFYKGKLNTSMQIRKNSVHKERFFMEYDEFLPDRSENRIIKATLQKLLKLSESAGNRKLIKQLLLQFDGVSASIQYDVDFSKIVISRNTKLYENLMNWSKVFLKEKSFVTFTGAKDARALLFPMETVFESYVGQEIQKFFKKEGWNVSLQDHGKYLFTDPCNKFALRPDIVMRKEDKIFILDTKWKILIDNKRKNYGITQSDMYQMYAYGKKYQCEHIILLYPLNYEMADKSSIAFHSGDGITVEVIFVHLSDMKLTMREIENSITSRIKGDKS